MNKTNKPGSKSLNLIPLIGDFTLLTFGVLILVFVGALFTLARSEMPTTFESDLYFPSGSWELTSQDASKLYTFIEDSIFIQINQEFKKGSLVSLRIDGHTDIVPPAAQSDPKEDKKFLGIVKIKKNKRNVRRWEDNTELSFFRAKEVSSIFNRIIDNSLFSLEEKQKLKKMIVVSGLGPNQPQFKLESYLGKYYAADIDSVNRDSEGYFKRLGAATFSKKNGPFPNKEEALENIYRLNRRVVINVIKKGI